MKLLLLQDEIYVPSFAGGTKANRRLLEEFVDSGHQCLALTRALTSSSDGPNNRTRFLEEMSARQTAVEAVAPHVFSYINQGVQVEALDFQSTLQRREYIVRRIQDFQPDWILVADDKRRFMLEGAIRAAADHVIPLVQTIIQLPFGPLALHESRRQTQLMRQARAIIVISNFLRDYIDVHGALDSQVLYMPVYGHGPFPSLARSDAVFVTMINPCELKGVTIFLELAREYPQVSFAAVPTWGADDMVLRDLRGLPNVTILEPADDIAVILAQTRVLLVPSLWPETFGYVVPEAMLRGIPVLASNIGGLPEAKLGVDYLLPVAPARQRAGSYVSPPQDTAPWSKALRELLFDAGIYNRCSRESREAAQKFAAGVSVSAFESLLTDLAVGRKLSTHLADGSSLVVSTAPASAISITLFFRVKKSRKLGIIHFIEQ
jgi:glycosyltransferase involved in cell wall biosynthesis